MVHLSTNIPAALLATHESILMQASTATGTLVAGEMRCAWALSRFNSNRAMACVCKLAGLETWLSNCSRMNCRQNRYGIKQPTNGIRFLNCSRMKCRQNRDGT